jgi:hypothetical protein
MPGRAGVEKAALPQPMNLQKAEGGTDPHHERRAYSYSYSYSHL